MTAYYSPPADTSLPAVVIVDRDPLFLLAFLVVTAHCILDMVKDTGLVPHAQVIFPGLNSRNGVIAMRDAALGCTGWSRAVGLHSPARCRVAYFDAAECAGAAVSLATAGIHWDDDGGSQAYSGDESKGGEEHCLHASASGVERVFGDENLLGVVFDGAAWIVGFLIILELPRSGCVCA